MTSSNIIYKYFPPERLSYFEDELIRITQPADLNDPFECVPILPTVEEVIEILNEMQSRLLENISHSKLPKAQKKENNNNIERKYKTEITNLRKDKKGNLRERYRAETNKKINGRVGILSLSRRWDSSLMWSHYSKSHKGFCIGFNTSDCYFSNYKDKTDGDILFRPITYSENRIKVPVTKDEYFTSDVLITKATDWKYEEEERLLVRLTSATKKIPRTPFDIFLFKVPHFLIKEIIVGANIQNTDLEIIKKFCTAKTIDLYESHIAEFKFDMIRTQV